MASAKKIVRAVRRLTRMQLGGVPPRGKKFSGRRYLRAQEVRGLHKLGRTRQLVREQLRKG